jgi:hypothetical protein
MVPDPCEHKCHSGRGLNPWVETCPVCFCPNANYDAINAARLQEEFVTETGDAGLTTGDQVTWW